MVKSAMNDADKTELEQILQAVPFSAPDADEIYQVDGKWYIEKEDVVFWVQWWSDEHVKLVPIRDPDQLPRKL